MTDALVEPPIPRLTPPHASPALDPVLGVSGSAEFTTTPPRHYREKANIMTTKVRITKNQLWTVLRDTLACVDEFANSNGTFRGQHNVGLPFTGILPADEVDKLREDRPTYVVYSYATPIGWRREDGTWYVPDVHYSVTTSAHQGKLRVAVASI